jgi:hypothetical protein
VFGGLVLYWGVRRIWTWKEPMSAPAKFMTVRPRRPRRPSFVEGVGQTILAIVAMVFGLYLFLVLIKFLWARA